MLQRLPVLDGRELNFAAYLLKIARNVCYDAIEARRRVALVAEHEDLPLDGPLNVDEDPERAALLRPRATSSGRERVAAAASAGGGRAARARVAPVRADRRDRWAEGERGRAADLPRARRTSQRGSNAVQGARAPIRRSGHRRVRAGAAPPRHGSRRAGRRRRWGSRPRAWRRCRRRPGALARDRAVPSLRSASTPARVLRPRAVAHPRRRRPPKLGLRRRTGGWPPTPVMPAGAVPFGRGRRTRKPRRHSDRRRAPARRRRAHHHRRRRDHAGDGHHHAEHRHDRCAHHPDAHDHHNPGARAPRRAVEVPAVAAQPMSSRRPNARSNASPSP